MIQWAHYLAALTLSSTSVSAEKDKVKEKAQKKVLTEAQKKNPNLRLTANPKVKVWNEEPMLHST